MKVFEVFRLEILEVNVCFCIGMSWEEIHKYVREEYNEESTSFIDKIKDANFNSYFACYETNEHEGYDYLIFLKDWTPDNKHYVTLAHEAVHIVNYFQKIYGIDSEETEFLARLHSNIMNECLGIIENKEDRNTSNEKHKLAEHPLTPDECFVLGTIDSNKSKQPPYVGGIREESTVPNLINLGHTHETLRGYIPEYPILEKDKIAERLSNLGPVDNID